MSARALNLLVFRDGRKRVGSLELRAALAQAVQTCASEPYPANFLRALLHAGELECGLADSPAGPDSLQLTESLAAALVGDKSSPGPEKVPQLPPAELLLSPPEGFAYYGLHPLQFAQVFDRVTPRPPRAVVIGIRSIGTTLSAVSAARLGRAGIETQRMTVRPSGHPYDRRTEFSPRQLAMVRSGASGNAAFFIVDEGPGLSGSSFLSVAEALVSAGVPDRAITLVCSYEPHVDALCAPGAPQRWRRFSWISAHAEPRRPPAATTYIGGGEWRRYLLPGGSAWPESWVSFERLKYLSGSGDPRFYKFQGLGHYGASVAQREQQVAAAGFGPLPLNESDGLFSYSLIDGRSMNAGDLSESVLARLAAYCAFRASAFAQEEADLPALQQMASHNLQELRFDVDCRLELERPVLADGRMQPYEWRLTSTGQMLKTDAGTHGDDHFYPGPVDIAWDLAGAMVEWKMNAAQAATLLDMYRRASGDDPRPRLAPYLKAYAVFRSAYCLMAANALQGTEEHRRLEQAAANYGALLTEERMIT